MLVFLKKTIKVSLIVIAFFSIVGVVFAQESISSSMSSININISPINPSAGDSVVLTLSSNLLELESSKIIWYIDGVVRKETTSRSITIKTKSSGLPTTIRVIVETNDGIIKETSREISPGGIDLIIEPMSYTLPFYQGKPLFVAQGKVKIVALPNILINGSKPTSKNLYFNWTKDGYSLSENSGKGKDSIIINSVIPIRDINVGVQILDSGGNVLAENSKTITKNDPKILFFENSPLYGVLYNRAVVGNYFLGTKEELTIVAKPFSFDFANDTSSESNYSWYVNDNLISVAGKANEILMRQATTSSGTISVSLSLSNINKINQFSNSGFNVNFGK